MSCFFFFNDTATTEIYTLSLHDALPICPTDIGDGRVPGSLHAGTNYVANVGSGTVGFGLIASGDGIFTQTPLGFRDLRSEEHTSELQSQSNLVCRLLLEKKKKHQINYFK